MSRLTGLQAVQLLLQHLTRRELRIVQDTVTNLLGEQRTDAA